MTENSVETGLRKEVFTSSSMEIGKFLFRHSRTRVEEAGLLFLSPSLISAFLSVLSSFSGELTTDSGPQQLWPWILQLGNHITKAHPLPHYLSTSPPGSHWPG